MSLVCIVLESFEFNGLSDANSVASGWFGKTSQKGHTSTTGSDSTVLGSPDTNFSINNNLPVPETRQLSAQQSIPKDSVPQLDSTPIWPHVELEGQTPLLSGLTPSINRLSELSEVSRPSLYNASVADNVRESNRESSSSVPLVNDRPSDVALAASNLNKNAMRQNSQHIMSWADFGGAEDNINFNDDGLGITTNGRQSWPADGVRNIPMNQTVNTGEE
jgi:hypothetical protein